MGSCMVYYACMSVVLCEHDLETVESEPCMEYAHDIPWLHPLMLWCPLGTVANVKVWRPLGNVELSRLWSKCQTASYGQAVVEKMPTTKFLKF